MRPNHQDQQRIILVALKILKVEKVLYRWILKHQEFEHNISKKHHWSDMIIKYLALGHVNISLIKMI